FDLVEHPLAGPVIHVRGDVRDGSELQRAMHGQQVVFHLAAILGVEKITPIPHEVLEVNLQGTVNALRAAAENGVERFVFSSSSEVYGEPLRIPILETDPTAPISIYGTSKLAAEAYCTAYQTRYGLPTT